MNYPLTVTTRRRKRNPSDAEVEQKAKEKLRKLFALIELNPDAIGLTQKEAKLLKSDKPFFSNILLPTAIKIVRRQEPEPEPTPTEQIPVGTAPTTDSSEEMILQEVRRILNDPGFFDTPDMREKIMNLSLTPEEEAEAKRLYELQQQAI